MMKSSAGRRFDSAGVEDRDDAEQRMDGDERKAEAAARGGECDQSQPPSATIRAASLSSYASTRGDRDALILRRWTARETEEIRRHTQITNQHQVNSAWSSLQTRCTTRAVMAADDAMCEVVMCHAREEAKLR